MSHKFPHPGIVPWVRWVPLVLTPLMLLASNFPGEYRVPLGYWLIALAAAVTFLMGGRWPLAVSLVLSALAVPMFAMDAWGLSGLVPYLGAVGLAEVAMRFQRPLPVVSAGAGWTAAVLSGIAAETYSTFWRPATAVETVAVVGLPLLFGLYLRAQRDLAETFRARAADAEARRAEDAALVRAAERSALARELHDLVAHHMASIVLRVGVAQHVSAEADHSVRSVLDDVHATASGALEDIRRLLVVLRDPSLAEVNLVETGSVAAEIAASVERTRAAGLTVDFEMNSDLGDLDAIGRLTMLRVVQESLTNVMKHADGARPVTVAIEREDHQVMVSIASYFTGGKAAPDGHGLIGMSERVALAGGTLEVGADGTAWHVHVALPMTGSAVSR